MEYDEYTNLLKPNETEFNSSISIASLDPERETKILILSTEKLLACIIGFLTDVFLILVISRYKNMKTPENLYIMHWLLSDSLVLFCDPAEYHLYRAIAHHNLPRPYICTIFSSNIIARIAEAVFTTIIIAHVYFEKHTAQFFSKHCKTVITFVWLCTSLVVVGVAMSCTLTSYDQSVGSCILGVSSSVAAVCFIGVHMKRRFSNPYIKGDNISLPLALVTTYFSSWAVYLLCLVVARILFFMINVEMVIKFITNILYLYPLVFLYLFHLLDPQFSVSVKYLFKKKINQEVVSYSGV